MDGANPSKIKPSMEMNTTNPSSSSLNQKEFRTVLFRALFFPLVSAFGLALLIAWQIRVLVDTTEWVDRSQQVISQSHRVQKLLADMETSVRGFALTGHKDYLSPYEEARFELESALEKITALLDENGEQQKRVAAVKELSQQWASRYADITIRHFRQGKDLYDPEIGRKFMEEMRTELLHLAQTATIQREERFERAETMARVFSGTGVLFTLSIGFFLALSARRQIFRLTDLYQRSLTERNALLQSETHRSHQLQALSEAAVTLNSTLDLSERLKLITLQARQIIGAHQATTAIFLEQDWDKARSAVSLSEKYEKWKDREPQLQRSDLHNLVCRQGRALRLTQLELEQHYAWKDLHRDSALRPPLRGWLAAPLVGQDGKNLGLIQLSDRFEGDFTAEDEIILVQISQIASVAIENARLFESQQEAVRTRDEFLSIASHELKTPLTSLKLQVQLLGKTLAKLEPALRERLHTYLEQSVKSVDRIAHLVDDMLDISRISAGRLTLQKEKFDLSQLVNEISDRLMPLLQQSKCELHFGASESVLGQWDRFRIDQVATNLITNAVKYGAGAPIEVHVKQEDDHASISVRDHGIGIAKEYHEKIFQRFERLSSNSSVAGMGLGLYIARQIVEMHGGNILVKSEPGQGAEFEVQLPLQ